MRPVKTTYLVGLLGLALVFWTAIFGLKLVNFWIGMAVAASTLAFLSVRYAGWPVPKGDWSLRHLGIGVASALALYVIFFAGDALASWLFSFAKPEVADIYRIREEGTLWAITFVLTFVTSPAEEIFWRGFVQRAFMDRLGAIKGLWAGAAVYGGVHLLSGNLMLMMAALVAGIFWGWLYMRTQSLAACIVSHAIWTVSVFVIWPIH